VADGPTTEDRGQRAAAEAGGGTRALRVANGSGFYGDRFEAPRELLEGGPIDVLTGDYLAELTMLILWRAKQKDATTGYARTFRSQMEECMGLALDRGVRIVTNAGGLNPAGLADALRELADELGLDARIAHIEGDDLLGRLEELQDDGHDLAHLDTGAPLASITNPPLTANAYLGSWGIVEALDAGADIVVCPRVTDAALAIGPAAWHFGWDRDDWDRLAGALVAGHVIECGAQATGGNYAFFAEVPGLEHPGFPIAEIDADGSSTITKHERTGGLVSVGTVTAQLLYEIAGPRYASPDVMARFDTIELEPSGDDRVRITGVRGEPAPDELKIAINTLGGFRNEMTFVLTGLDVEAKAALVRRTLEQRLDLDTFDEIDFRLVGAETQDPERNEDAIAHMRVVVKARQPDPVGRAFSRVPVELALSNYPGFTMTAPPGSGDPFGIYWPTLVNKDVVTEVAVLPDGSRLTIEPVRAAGSAATAADELIGAAARHDERVAAGEITVAAGEAETRDVPLGTIVGARSGDKGGNANVGLWTRTDEAFAWLDGWLTTERFRDLLPEAADLRIDRYRLPNLRALNFVVVGLLGMGVSASTRPDPQAKGLGEYLRARVVPIPETLLD
jgi:hypothetical protein